MINQIVKEKGLCLFLYCLINWNQPPPSKPFPDKFFPLQIADQVYSPVPHLILTNYYTLPA